MERNDKGRFESSGNKDPFLEDWLENNFTSRDTQNTYRTAIMKFKRKLDIENLKTYFENLSPEKAQEDFKQYVAGLNGGPSKTINTYSGAVKVFFQDHGIEINGLKVMRRRGFLPRRVKAQTQDRPPTVEELKKIVNYMSLGGRALTLFCMHACKPA